MKSPKFTKDQIQKLVLGTMGFVFLIYVYLSFFLGPLTRNRDSTRSAIKGTRSKLDGSKGEIDKAAKLEVAAKSATERFAAFEARIPEGAPIAWFPPRIKTFFANQQIDKPVARLDNSAAFRPNEMKGWLRYNWLIELPQADYATTGRAIAELENTEPLLAIMKLSIHTSQEQAQFQKVDLAIANIISEKK